MQVGAYILSSHAPSVFQSEVKIFFPGNAKIFNEHLLLLSEKITKICSLDELDFLNKDNSFLFSSFLAVLLNSHALWDGEDFKKTNHCFEEIFGFDDQETMQSIENDAQEETQESESTQKISQEEEPREQFKPAAYNVLNKVRMGFAAKPVASQKKGILERPITQAEWDPHAVLGLDKSAKPEDVRAAYRKLSTKLHPDKVGGDKDAEEAFKILTAAYQTINKE